MACDLAELIKMLAPVLSWAAFGWFGFTVQSENMVIKIPFSIGPYQGVALGPVILIKFWHERLIPHEQVHQRQQREHGLLRYLWKWATDKNFRVRMEIEAYRADGLSDVEIHGKLTHFYGIGFEDAWERLK